MAIVSIEVTWSSGLSKTFLCEDADVEAIRSAASVAGDAPKIVYLQRAGVLINLDNFRSIQVRDSQVELVKEIAKAGDVKKQRAADDLDAQASRLLAEATGRQEDTRRPK